jgi:hypothetical protein
MKTRTNFSNVRMHAESLGSWSARVFFFWEKGYVYY